MSHSLAVATLSMALAASFNVQAEQQLQSIVDARLAGDRTGACMAVAVIEKDQVTRTFRCANPADAGRIGADAAFEIGSVSKTMTAVLLAEMFARGQGSLDDRLADWLPAGTAVPEFEGQPILLRHVVMHTSGLPALPSRLGTTNYHDPYANLTEEALLASLADVQLSAAPGSHFDYSNFASMLLSYAVARRAGKDFESLARERLFAPLGMDGAYINSKPQAVREAKGHTPNAQETPPWRFATNLGGVGGVRATLEDMVRYVQGNLGQRPSSISAALEAAQQPLGGKPPMAMNWMLVPVGDRTVHAHEGGTGGFSSWVSIDRERQRGVVILSDTTWNSIGSLGSLGLHLVDESFPLGKPRRLVAADAALLASLEGTYQLQGAMKITLRQRDGRLFVQAEGQSEFEMAHDDAGDFFPLELDAVLKPRIGEDGVASFTWTQMGGVMAATRIDAAAAPVPPALDAAQLQAYAGDYPLMLDFVLSIRARDGSLYGQATGQGEFPLQAASEDEFHAPALGLRIRFQRDADGQVQSLRLQQGGAQLEGRRQ